MLDTARLGRIAVKFPGKYQIGTCYAIADDLVLTAEHVLRGVDRQSIQVRFLEGEQAWEPAEVAWQSVDLDAALLRVQRPRRYDSTIRWGTLGGTAAPHWEGAGFPSAGEVELADGNRLRESVDVRGRVGPYGGRVQRLLELTVDGAPPDAVLWKGLSGSPVLVDGYLVGLIRSTPPGFGGTRLWATPLWRLLEDAAFTGLLGAIACVPVGATATAAVSPPASTRSRPTQLFCAFASEDQPQYEALSSHLAPMRHAGQVALWHGGLVPPGHVMEEEISRRLESADVVLLLLGAGVLDEHPGIIRRAVERHKQGEALVVPIWARPGDWKNSIVGGLTPLPSNGQAITLWDNPDLAWADVVSGLRPLLLLWHWLPGALASVMPTAADAQPFLFNLGLPTQLNPVKDSLLLWRKIVQEVAQGRHALTPFDLVARALQDRPHDTVLQSLRASLQVEDRLGTAAPSPVLPAAARAPSPAEDSTDAATALKGIAEAVHDAAIRNGAELLLQGRYVAFLAPSGFGASRCLRGVLDRCRKQGQAVTFRLTPLPLAPTLAVYLDDLTRQLGRQVPLPAMEPGQDPKVSFLERLRQGLWALHDQRRRLVLAIDEAERFHGREWERLTTLLGLLAQLYEERPDAAPENLGVAVAGGEDLHRLLRGPEYFRGLSVFRAEEIRLGRARPPAHASAAVRAALEALGGHPELLLWAAGRGGRVDGRPEDDVPILRQQLERFRSSPLREQVLRLLRKDATAWADPAPELRWSGWLRDAPQEGPGWLGPVLEALARRAMGDS